MKINTKDKIKEKLECTLDVNIQEQDERTILSMIIGDNTNKAYHIIESLDKDMFVSRKNQFVFTACKEIMDLKYTPNRQYLNSVIEDEPMRDYINQLDYEFITNVNCDFFINRIRNSYIERGIVNATSADEARKILKLRDTFTQVSNIEDKNDIARRIIKNVFEPDSRVAVDLGYKSITDKIGYLRGGDVMVLAGGTGMGKTCMALNLANRIQKKNKLLMFSLEMSAEQLETRIMCADLDIDSFKLRNNYLSEQEKAMIKGYLENHFTRSNLEICSRKKLTVSQIYDIVKASDCEVVIIDYLGLIKGETYGKRYEVITEISREIKLMALELNKPIILLHQINREYMSREDKHPILSDLRDSGAIEQDADFVCFVHRPFIAGDDIVDDHIEFLVRKNRFGENNTGARLIFNGKCQRISESEDLEL